MTAYELYKTLAEVPYLSALQLFKLEDLYSLNAVFTQRDHFQKIRRKVQSNYALIKRPDSSYMSKVDLPGTSADITDSVRTAFSADGMSRIILRHVGKDQQRKRIIECWRGSALLWVEDVTEHHGDFFGEDTFGSLQISQDTNWIVYIAEAKHVNDKFGFVQSWGERFAKARNPAIFIIPWNAESREKPRSPIRILLSETFSPADVRFASNGQHPLTLIFTGYDVEPRKYGIVYCTNRPARIYSVTINPENAKLQDVPKSITKAVVLEPTKLEALSDKTRSSRSPRISPDGKVLVWLDNPLGGAHASCSRLISCDLDARDQKQRVMCDTVQDINSAEDFPGLFLDALPQHPFLDSGQQKWKLVLSSIWRSVKKILVFDLEKAVLPHVIIEMNVAAYCYSMVVYSCMGPYIVASRSSPNSLHEVFILEFIGGEYKASNLATLNASLDVKDIIDPIAADVLPVKDKPYMEVVHIYQTYPSESAKTKAKPIVLFPHGGPHSTTTTDFPHSSPHHLVLAHLGYDVLLVNYSGSLGFGQAGVESLIGKIGSQEVEETVKAVELLKDFKSRPVVLMGGSHGGYIGASIVAKYPVCWQRL